MNYSELFSASVEARAKLDLMLTADTTRIEGKVQQIMQTHRQMSDLMKRESLHTREQPCAYCGTPHNSPSCKQCGAPRTQRQIKQL